MTKLTLEKVAPILAEERGNMAAVARRFRCSRQSVHTFVHKHPSLVQVAEDARESVVDDVVSNLYRTALGPPGPQQIVAAIFIAKTLGKSRGFVERQEIEHSGSIDTEGSYERIAGKLAGVVTAAGIADSGSAGKPSTNGTHP